MNNNKNFEKRKPNSNFSIKNSFSKLWEFVAYLTGAILTITGLIEVYQQYFPENNNQIIVWLSENLQILLFLIALIAVITIIFLGKNNNELQKKLGSIYHSGEVNKIILFISPCPGGGGDFYQEHFSHLVKAAARKATPQLNLNITLICPSKDFGRDPELLLSMAENYPAKVSGVFMIPAYPDKAENWNGILAFKEKFPAIVLIDVYPIIDQSKPQESIHFVGGDEEKGGAAAARLAERWLSKLRKKKYRILILIGRSTPWEKQRVNSFKAPLKSKFGENIAFMESMDLHYEYERARKKIETLVNEGEKLESFDLIFSCNDEMAIGALDYIQTIVNERKMDIKKIPKIIGYDGIPEMKRLIEMKNEFILGTVEVQIEDQAEYAIKTMVSLLRKQKPQKTKELLQPRTLKNHSLL